MFCPLEYREAIMIVRGLLILVVVILIGVSVTQQQLHSLTQRQEAQAFMMSCDQHGVYSICLLGVSYHIRAVYLVGEIVNHNQSIMIRITNRSVVIPTYIHIDCKKELVLLDLWTRLLVEEFFKFKQKVES